PSTDADGAERDLHGTDLDSGTGPAAGTGGAAAAKADRLPDVLRFTAGRKRRDADYTLRLAVWSRACAITADSRGQRAGGRGGARVANGERARRASGRALPGN